MNRAFIFGRFCKLVADDARANRSKYLLTLCLAVGIPFVITMLRIFNFCGNPAAPNPFALHYDAGYEVEEVMFWVMFFIIACFSGSQVFANIAKKTDRVHELMLPASQLEKYLARVFLMVPATLVAFVLLYEVQDVLRMLLTALVYHRDVEIEALGLEPFKYGDETWMTIAIMLGLQSFFVLGSALWPKRSMLKTFLAMMLIGIVISTASSLMIFWTPSDMYLGDLIVDFDLSPVAITIALSAVACVINYTLAYFRLKEQEIINRW